MDLKFDASLTVLVFALYTMLSNIVPNWVKFPWDIDLSKFGIGFYLPILSSLILTVVLILLKKLLGF